MGRLILTQFGILLLVVGIKCEFNESSRPEDAIFEITALYDHEKGVILYKDPSIQACFIEISDARGRVADSLKILPIPEEAVLKNYNGSLDKFMPHSRFEHEFCNEFPIFRIDGSDSHEIAEERTLTRVHRARRKRQSYSPNLTPQYGQGQAQSGGSGGPAGAAQAQVQGSVSGHGFFSGQAQSIANGMSQSQLQLGGVGLTGNIAGSAGGAQAQLSLGSRTGSGQASNSGLGPSSSQVQVQLGEANSGSNARANIVQHHSTGGGQTGDGSTIGGVGGAGLGYQEGAQQYGGQGQPYAGSGGQRYPQFYTNGQRPKQPYYHQNFGSQVPYQQTTGSQGYHVSGGQTGQGFGSQGQSTGYPGQIPLQQGTGSQGHYNGYRAQAPYRQTTGTHQGQSNGFQTQVPFRPSTGHQGQTNGQQAAGYHGTSTGYPGRAPLPQATHQQGSTNGYQAQVPLQQGAGQTHGYQPQGQKLPQQGLPSRDQVNGYKTQVPIQPPATGGQGQTNGYHQGGSGYPAPQQGLQPDQTGGVGSRATQQYPARTGFPAAQGSQYYGHPSHSTSGAGSRTQGQGTQSQPGASSTGNGKFTQSQQIYINGYRQGSPAHLQQGQAGAPQSSSVGSQYPGIHVSAPGGQAQAQAVVLDGLHGGSGAPAFRSDFTGLGGGATSSQDRGATFGYQGQGRSDTLNTEQQPQYPTGDTQQQLPVDGTSQYPAGGIQPQYPAGGIQQQYPAGGIPQQYPAGGIPLQQYPSGGPQAQYPAGESQQQYPVGGISQDTGLTRGQSSSGDQVQQTSDQGQQQPDLSYTPSIPQVLPGPVQAQDQVRDGTYDSQGGFRYTHQQGYDDSRRGQVIPGGQVPLQTQDTRTSQYYPPAQPQVPLPGYTPTYTSNGVIYTPNRATEYHGQIGPGNGNGGSSRCHTIIFTCTVIIESDSGHRKLCRPKSNQNGGGQQVPAQSNPMICCC